MNEGQSRHTDKQAGFCSASCMDQDCVRREIGKPELKTSDLYAVCDLPKRFEHPHWFNGYGCQVSKQHPFYRTSASQYGWYPPGQQGALCANGILSEEPEIFQRFGNIWDVQKLFTQHSDGSTAFEMNWK